MQKLCATQASRLFSARWPNVTSHCWIRLDENPHPSTSRNASPEIRAMLTHTIYLTKYNDCCAESRDITNAIDTNFTSWSTTCWTTLRLSRDAGGSVAFKNLDGRVKLFLLWITYVSYSTWVESRITYGSYSTWDESWRFSKWEFAIGWVPKMYTF